MKSTSMRFMNFFKMKKCTVLATIQLHFINFQLNVFIQFQIYFVKKLIEQVGK